MAGSSKKVKSYSIEDWKDFIHDCEIARTDWEKQAKRSWQDIKKQTSSGKMWSTSPNSARKRVHYQLWWSSYKLKQPLYYSRTPLPLGRDTQEGDDPTGRTAAICLERLARSILKTFDFDAPMKSARDDALVTDFGQVRAYFTCDDVEEQGKEYVTEAQDDEGNTLYVDENGEPCDQAAVQQDEQGFYIPTAEVVDVENEKVYLDHVLYTDIYIDPDVRHWDQVRVIAFKKQYSRREFKRVFGKEALNSIAESDDTGAKRKVYDVFEGWDFAAREVKWWCRDCGDFIKPLVDDTDGDDADDTPEDGYRLERFFPCPPPFRVNAPTDHFYPICEFYQLHHLIEDVHALASRMYAATRAIRVRLMFDASVPELQPLISEVAEADAIGVNNLQQALAAGQGKLENLVAYLPIGPLVDGLKNLYEALQQRIQSYYELSGDSDILRGQTDGEERTYGEQQLKAKFGLNRHAEGCEEMQRFACDAIQLLAEVALKNFKDQTLRAYIVPQTLDDEDQQRYDAAIALLKSDRQRRFRVELETDSTRAINDEYEKAARLEIANTFTKALESVAQVAEKDTNIANCELKILLHLVKGFRQGKLFEDEITQAIEAVIKKQEEKGQAAAPPDPAMMDLQIKQQQLVQDDRKNAADAQLRASKQQQDYMLAVQAAQLEQAKLQRDYQQMQQEYEKALADVQLKNQELLILREKNQIESGKVGNDALLKQARLELEKQIAGTESQLAMMSQQLDQQRVALDMRERYMTENRLQFESQLEQMRIRMEAMRPPEQSQSQVPQVTVVNNPSKASKKVTRVLRDEAGNMLGTETDEIPLA